MVPPGPAIALGNETFLALPPQGESFADCQLASFRSGAARAAGCLPLFGVRLLALLGGSATRRLNSILPTNECVGSCLLSPLTAFDTSPRTIRIPLLSC